MATVQGIMLEFDGFGLRLESPVRKLQRGAGVGQYEGKLATVVRRGTIKETLLG